MPHVLLRSVCDVPDTVKSCIVCGQPEILVTTRDRLIQARCRRCHAVFEVEYEPPDAPDLRGRIELITPPDDRDW